VAVVVADEEQEGRQACVRLRGGGCGGTFDRHLRSGGVDDSGFDKKLIHSDSKGVPEGREEECEDRCRREGSPIS